MTKHLVRDLMKSEVMTLRPWNLVLNAYDEMIRKHVRHAPVLNENGELVGLLTQRDIMLRAMYPTDEVSHAQQRELLRLLQVSEIMSTGIVTVNPYDPLSRAAIIMLERKFGCLPAVLNGQLVGILTEADFVKYVLTQEIDTDCSLDRFQERHHLQALA